MWIVARYLPVSFFSLKPANATSSGGKTLLIPTPFALKMALLTAVLRLSGLEEGQKLFPFVRDLDLSIDPPPEIIVMKSFSKIRRELKDKNDPEKVRRAREEKGYPMQSTIAYREYVTYQGHFQLACSLAEDHPLAQMLPELFLHINYFGKRGGFMQIMGYPQTSTELPAGQFIHLAAQGQASFDMHGTPQMLDDCGPGLTFAKANIFDEAKIVLHKDRVLRHIVLPHQLMRSSRSYSWYQQQPLQ